MTVVETPRPTRIDALDISRGLAVIGVVFNHVVTGLLDAGLLVRGTALSEVNDILYLARMPALVFVLGLFIPRGVTRRGTTVYLVDRLRTVVWLYLVWFVLQSSLRALLQPVTTHDAGWSALFRPWETPDQLWFLPFLAVATLAVVGLRPWESSLRATYGLLVALVVSTMAWGWNPAVVGVHGVSLLVFAVAGAAIGLSRTERWLGGHGWAVAGVCGVVVLVVAARWGAIPAILDHPDRSEISVVLGLIAGVAGVVVVLALGRAAASLPQRPRRLLVVIGRSTLAIYLGHYLVEAAGRIVLTRIGLGAPWLLIPVLIVGGIAVPLALASASRALGAGRWLFEPPAWMSTKPSRGSSARHRWITSE